MPLPNSRIVQNQTSARATRHPERTGIAQHHRPDVTSATLKTRKPTARSLLNWLLTKRAGAKTSYSRATYSSMECAAWARIRKKNTSWTLFSTKPLATPQVPPKIWHVLQPGKLCGSQLPKNPHYTQNGRDGEVELPCNRRLAGPNVFRHRKWPSFAHVASFRAVLFFIQLIIASSRCSSKPTTTSSQPTITGTLRAPEILVISSRASPSLLISNSTYSTCFRERNSFAWRQ